MPSNPSTPPDARPPLTGAAFAARCQPAAADLTDRLGRYASSWRDWDAAHPTLEPWLVRQLLHRWPWELV
jgi:hypothetical protein